MDAQDYFHPSRNITVFQSKHVIIITYDQAEKEDTALCLA